MGTITNVETVLTGLASTYATISSLSAYVKSSLTNTFSALQTFSSGISVTGGIGLPSSTMTAPASNQIGYSVQVSSTAGPSQGSQTLCYFTPAQLAPVGSVWIVNANINCLANGNIQLQQFGCQTSLSNTGWTNGAQGATGIGISMTSDTTYSSQRSQQSVCGTFANTTASTYLLCGFAWFSSNGGATMTQQTYMTATRIA